MSSARLESELVAAVSRGTLGSREHRQRIGRVLRPSPGKRAIVHELVTVGTLDDARSSARRRDLPVMDGFGRAAG